MYNLHHIPVSEPISFPYQIRLFPTSLFGYKLDSGRIKLSKDPLETFHIPVYRYDEKTQTMDRGYPQRVVKHFPGIGLRIDAAFQHKGKR